MKTKLIILVGPPCSGKSTWSKNYVKNNPRTLRFNRDEIRLMLKCTPVLLGLEENIVTKMIDSGIAEAISCGRDVIIDQTNCRLKYIIRFITEYEDTVDIKIKVFTTDMSTLKLRNQLRSVETHIPPIPDRVIERMLKSQQFLLQSEEFKEFKKKGYILNE